MFNLLFGQKSPDKNPFNEEGVNQNLHVVATGVRTKQLLCKDQKIQGHYIGRPNKCQVQSRLSSPSFKRGMGKLNYKCHEKQKDYPVYFKFKTPDFGLWWSKFTP